MSSISILLFLALLPVIAICLFIYEKDKNKEPVKLLVKLFGLGVVSCFVTLAYTNAFGTLIPFVNNDPSKMNFFQVLLYSFLVVAFIEEVSKWIMVYFVGYKNKEFNELYDIIVYSVFVSLGFACFENILYVVPSQNIITGIFRALLSVPGHACDAIAMGYFLSIAKIYQIHGRKDLEKRSIIYSILVPTILHGIYDFCIMSGITIMLFAFIAFIIALYIISIKKLHIIANSEAKISYRNAFCPECGHKVNGPFCKNCGARQV